jgi:hypothetical protein
MHHASAVFYVFEQRKSKHCALWLANSTHHFSNYPRFQHRFLLVRHFFDGLPAVCAQALEVKDLHHRQFFHDRFCLDELLDFAGLQQLRQ